MEATVDDSADSETAVSESAPRQQKWSCFVQSIRSGNAQLGRLALPGSVEEVTLGDKHTALVVSHYKPSSGGPVPTLLLYGFASDEQCQQLFSAVIAERDTLAYIPKSTLVPDAVAKALVAAMWRIMTATDAQGAELMDFYFSGWGGDEGKALFGALWRVFSSLLPPESYDPAAGASPDDVVRAADAFTRLLVCSTQADVLARLLFVSSAWGPAPDALSAWARTPSPDARDFMKLLACMEKGARTLHRANPGVLVLLLGLPPELCSVPPNAPGASSLFSTHGRAWFSACAERDRDTFPTSSVDRFLLCLSPAAALWAAAAAASRGDLGAMELALALSTASERLDSLLSLDENTSLSTALFSHFSGPSFLTRCALLIASPGGDAGVVHAPCIVLALVRWGMAHGRLRATYHVLESILFEADAVTLTAFGIAALQDDPDMPLLDLLSGTIAAVASSTLQVDLLCGLFEIVLRCAKATQSGPVTTTSEAARCDAAFIAKLPSLPRRYWPALAKGLNFTGYLNRVHALSAEAMTDGSQSASALETYTGVDAENGRADPDCVGIPGLLQKWHSRSQTAALAACTAYLSMCARQRPGAVQQFFLASPEWLASLLSLPIARALLASALTSSPSYCLLWPAAVTSLVDDDGSGLLRHPSHWHPDALRALCLPSVVAQGASLVMDAPRLCPIVKEKDVEESLPTFAALDFSITTSTGSPGRPAEGRSRQSSVTEFIMYAGEQLLRGVRRHKEDVDTSEGEIAQDSLETPAEAEQDESESAAATKGMSRFSVVNGIFRHRSSAATTAEEAPAGEAKAAEGTEETAGAAEVPTPEAPKRASLFARFRRGSRQPSATSDAADPQAPSGDAVEVAPHKGAPDAKVEEPPATSTTEVAPSQGQPAVAAVSPLQPGAAAEEAPPVADVADLRRQDAQVVFELVELGLYLKKALRLDGDVIDLFVNMNDQKNGSAGAELHKRSVLMLLEDIRRRRVEGKTDEFFDSRRAGRPAVLDMGTINECACFARDALAMLASQPVSQGKLRGVFSYYVDRAAPAAWTGLFKGTSTIAFFLKYLDRESFPQAFAAFHEENTRADREPADSALYASLMARVAETYTAPLFTLQADALSDEAKVKELIDRIRDEGLAGGQTVLGMLRRVTAGWMELSKSKFQVPMAPRNAQIISCLLCCEWVRRRLEGHPSVPEDQRTFVTRVGTGEGKSLVIAMIAIYIVQILKKKVHVMEANEALLLRDVAEMKPFYALFGITVSANFGGFLRDEVADITYCCRRELNVYYRNALSKNPLGNTVLVLDEVDQLIVDESPNKSYVTTDIERSPLMRRMFDVWRAGGDGSEFPDDEIKKRIYHFGYLKGEKLRTSGQYARVEEQDSQTGEMKDVYVELDPEKGKPMRGFYFASCEYLNYVFQGVPPQYKSHYFYQSMPFMMNQYEAILGLSGSLGSPSEQAFMRATYGARTMLTPPFLNTCQAMRKHVPKLYGDRVYVHNTQDAQFAAIRRLALQYRDHVPVVVLANEVISAKAIFADCFTENDRDAGTVQLFLELDPVTGKPADYGSIVKEATRPRQSAVSPSGSVWPITVSDLFGGRGQDYTVLKEEVDNAGGIMVICTAIPDSEREWIQWLGRTARSDRRGQYAVILLSTDSPLKDCSEALRKHATGVPGEYKPSLVKELLDERDIAIKKKLDGLEKQLAHGLRMHEVCYDFWKAQRAGCDVAKFPADEAQKTLRGFVEKNSAMSTPEAVCAFAATAGLVSSPEEWKTKSKYCKY